MRNREKKKKKNNRALVCTDNERAVFKSWTEKKCCKTGKVGVAASRKRCGSSGTLLSEARLEP